MRRAEERTGDMQAKQTLVVFGFLCGCALAGVAAEKDMSVDLGGGVKLDAAGGVHDGEPNK